MPIKNSYIQLNTHPSLPVNPTDSDEETFGVLVLELNQVNITKRPLFILFTLDTTGSMSECVTHATTKIQYAVQTLKSIVKYLSTQNIDVYIQINTFDNDVVTIVPPTKISIQTHADMINILNTVDANGSTNIELALKSANASITQHATNNPTHTCVHIFMTDGEPTSGATTLAELLNCVSLDYMSINIGFGFDHNAKLLYQLSNAKNSEYHFVDNIEHASLVYGESLHKVLYPCLKNVRIGVKNGLIYDWLKNEWTTDIVENTLVSEIKKYYHVKTTTPNMVEGTIEAYHECETEENSTYVVHIDETILLVPDLIDADGNTLHDPSIVKFAFRQCILQLLYEVKRFDMYTDVDVIQSTKQRIKGLHEKLRLFADEHNMQTDGIVTQLLSDMYLAYWNIGTVHGDAYIFGRYTSQGNQSAYTPGNNLLYRNNTNGGFDVPPRPRIRRANHDYHLNIWETRGPPILFDRLDSFDSNDTGGITDNEYSSYSTPGARRTVSTIQSYDE